MTLMVTYFVAFDLLFGNKFIFFKLMTSVIMIIDFAALVLLKAQQFLQTLIRWLVKVKLLAEKYLKFKVLWFSMIFISW